MPLCGKAWDKSSTSLIAKTVIVTGANVGIGYYTALDFAKRGARLILACRTIEKAVAARDKIVEETGNENVFVKIIDMSSLASVREFANDINCTEERLDILVNNAGATGLGNHITEDGLQLIIQTNHLAPFLLTNLLLDLLKKSAPSRIVNVSSEAAFFTKIDPDNINSYPAGNATKAEWIAYSKTKLLNIMFTNELARRLEGTGVTANSLHPGKVHTEISRNLSPGIGKVFRGMSSVLFKTAEEGAQTSIYLAVSKDVADVTGEYFVDCHKAKMHSQAKNMKINKKVWEESEKLVKLNVEDTPL